MCIRDRVELGVVYVMIISSNAGLWSYNVGDTVKFTSLYPFRILVTGRLKHFISAFGEHVIGIEVERAINGIDLCVEALNKCSGSEIPMNISNSSLNKIAFTKKFPIGPVFAVSAFNHPLNLIVHQVGPAIAAGCPVIIKPSLDTPLSCYEFIKILRESRLPKDKY